ncbi:MAG: tRNA uridine-5-carboxymethylaminomethyl(34) synthesis GTPase MnmE [Chlamydiae bacterium]|nr:tRNA uridine-5-carboxymethylaminomethyl(34) synthesis GTPase MnmE [Chlamydiota bacterium]
MHFVHRPYTPEETIAAIATPIGEGGIAVIRVTGQKSVEIVAKIFSGPIHTYKTHTAHLGKITNLDQRLIDEVLVLVMLGSRSFCGENTVEIHCHGGSMVSRKVLEAVLSAGARAALPGEFSFKAFMNGKMDLTQAEAIQELIGAKNEIALRQAEEQLQGSLSKKIRSFQKELFDVAAILEAWVDFPEEGLEFASEEELLGLLDSTLGSMQTLANTFDEGHIIKEGLSLCLIGPPNAGKSSLMNTLLGQERAIVTNIPGTTRDILEEKLLLGGLHFTIKDTAGIRETEEEIEKEGIRRSKKAMAGADLVLLLFDITRALTDSEMALLAGAPKGKTLLVWNKADLPHANPIATLLPSIEISAKETLGIMELKEAIHKIIWKKGPPSQEEIILTNVRHKQALDGAIQSTVDVMQGLHNHISPEFIASDMRRILTELGTIIGTDINEEILGAIFSKFCVGK